MRKFYLLASFVLLLITTKTKSQDTANFTYKPGLSNQVFFTNNSHLHGDALRKAYWSFGDGIKQVTPPLSGVSHQYNSPGVFTVCLRIYKYSTTSNDSVITAEVCKSLTISNTSSSDSCRVEFVNSGSNTFPLTQAFIAKPWHNHEKKPEEICWTFGDNRDTCIKYDPTVSNNYTAYHSYLNSGQYKVCIRVRFQGGCVSEYCRMISVTSDVCKADFTMEPVTATPLARRFVAQPWNIQQKKPVRICWDFGDGTTECKQYLTTTTDRYAINHSYAKSGKYNVCVNILYDSGCESKICKTINIETPPPASDSCFLNVYEMATNTNNLERHFYAGLMQDRRAEKICWIFGDGKDTCINLAYPATSQLLVIAHRYQAPGIYRVCSKVKYANGCEVQKCREVIIRSFSTICGGYIVDSLVDRKTFAFKGFSIQNSNDHVTNWRWTFGDGNSSNNQNTSHTYATGGNYQVCLYIKTDLGCETKICKQITVQGETKTVLQLSPNPVTSTLHATFISLFQEQVTINIYNSNGILIKTYSRMALQGTNTWEFNTDGLAAGIYSVIVISSHQLANAIFFKQ